MKNSNYCTVTRITNKLFETCSSWIIIIKKNFEPDTMKQLSNKSSVKEFKHKGLPLWELVKSEKSACHHKQLLGQM